MKIITDTELTADWEKNKIEPIYYFSGEELAKKNKTIDLIPELFKPESFNYSVRYADKCDIDSFIDEAQTVPMLSDKRFLIIKKAQELKTDSLKKLLAYLENPCETSCVIISAEYQGSKDSISERLPESAVQVKFPLMSSEEAVDYLNNKLFRTIHSDEAALNTIVETAGTSIFALDTETDKILTYMSNKGKEIFDEEDAAALCGFSKIIKPFQLSNEIMAANREKAEQTAMAMLSDGEDPLSLLAQISSAIEKLLKIKFAQQDNILPVGISRGQMYYIGKYANNYTTQKLTRILNRCLSVENELKSSLKMNPSLLIRQLIIEITAK